MNLRNILVMRLDNIGDVLMIGPSLRALKQALPDAHLTLMASPAGAQAATLLPWINDVLVWRVLWQDLGKLAFDPSRERKLVETLRERHFDAVLIFTSFSQSPHPAALVSLLAGIPVRVGESQEADGLLTTALPPAPTDIHQVDRNLRVVEALGVPVHDRRLAVTVPQSAQQATDALLAASGLANDAPFLVLNPWTSCQARTYDPQRFAVAARQLAEQTTWPVVVVGTAKDRERSDGLFAELGDWAVDAMGATNVDELAALVARTKLMLTNNTATMHLADALRVPSVVLFAGTELEQQWQPRSSSTRLLRQPTTCSPCYAFTCLYNQECLDISPEAVVAAGLALLER